ncbi:hypothetical protein B9U12_21960 [Salmonella enterica]|nr:hypothetical protein [Salmonella enterica]HAK0848711.1 hypothetical protein [Salmonella enterica]HDO6129831.1 hypothetical protein [Salmonella enterica subsp. enterica serovar Typhimurium]HEC0613339.1 hypothetical protein [Salmonella enterica subsp. enterica serovar Havana]
MVNDKNLSAEFEKSLSAFCNWSLEKDEQGKYIDKNTQYAWSEYLRINYLNFLEHGYDSKNLCCIK